MPEKIISLGNQIEGLFLKDTRFSTTLLSFNFYLPLDRQKIAGFSLLPFLLTSCSKKYPDFSKLNYKLNKLYGANLSASTEKIGDLLMLKMSISTIDDKFALDNEPLTEQACELLLNLIFEPNIANGAFLPEDVEREKRKAIEHLRGEYADKRLYAKQRLIEEMYANSHFGAPKCGTEEQINALTGADLFTAWREMLRTAFVRVIVLSSALPPTLFQKITDCFSDISRECVTDCHAHTPTAPVGIVHTVTEHMDVTQGKISMGFSCEEHGSDLSTAPLFVMTDIFGGGPYSRLFTNVREKLSLCYYCSASAVRVKGLLTVDSGVESANAERAKQEILKQLEIVQSGKFSDFEFQSSIKSLSDTLNSIFDSQNAISNWYSNKISNEELLSPTNFAELIQKVTKDDVIRAAAGVKLHTVYELLPKEGA